MLYKFFLSFVLLTVSHLSFAAGDVSTEVPGWLVLPFVLLLLMVATGPLFYSHFWHKYYALISIVFAALVMGYYVFAMDNYSSPIHAIVEYIPFISFLAALYIASSGIAIQIKRKATTKINVLLLAFGAIIANIIGTTGASMLLIRPFIKMNGKRIKAYHIIFFIFIVSNVGGALTPIGDPPLFLGFLKGVPFFWTLDHNIFPCMFAVSLLLLFFYFKDSKQNQDVEEVEETEGSMITIKGKGNFIWLSLVAFAVFLDPNVFDFIPSIEYHGQKISFIKELIWIAIAFLSYFFASKKAHQLNEFNFEPIKEVAFLFIGIFGAMTPALDMVSELAKKAGEAVITTNVLYVLTGILSGFLDNAPTYVTFLTAGMSVENLDVGVVNDVAQFAEQFPLRLQTISVASVFFGALTYIGNGPNFMVKSIAEHSKIKMPSFVSYIVKYSVKYLAIVLFLTWLVFFSGWIIAHSG